MEHPLKGAIMIQAANHRLVEGATTIESVASEKYTGE